ncbi:hypothetical protein [Streptomyces sp. cg35]|uniref:hypothetical protein n=1 Tax=Streptomyces sp. cg35 TaxID=3421650 RepID=UPI003D18734A
MAGREYQGSGGLRLHLDEPLSDEMAKQVAKGHLVPVADEQAEETPQSPEAPFDPQDPPAGPDGDVKRPNANAKVDDWRTYAVSLGMPEEEAQEATKKDLQDWVEVAEGGSEGSGE